MRLRVAAYTAFASGWADRRDAWPPTPVGRSVLGTMWTSTCRTVEAQDIIAVEVPLLHRAALNCSLGFHDRAEVNSALSERGMYYGDTASTAKTRNFAN